MSGSQEIDSLVTPAVRRRRHGWRRVLRAARGRRAHPADPARRLRPAPLRLRRGRGHRGRGRDACRLAGESHHWVLGLFSLAELRSCSSARKAAPPAIRRRSRAPTTASRGSRAPRLARRTSGRRWPSWRSRSAADRMPLTATQRGRAHPVVTAPPRSCSSRRTGASYLSAPGQFSSLSYSIRSLISPYNPPCHNKAD